MTNAKPELADRPTTWGWYWMRKPLHSWFIVEIGPVGNRLGVLIPGQHTTTLLDDPQFDGYEWVPIEPPQQ